MDEIYYIDEYNIIPVSGVTRKSLFRGIPRGDEHHPKVFKKLKSIIPNFIDKNAVLEFGSLHLFDEEYHHFSLGIVSGGINYTIPLTNGRVEAQLTAYEDLQDFVKKFEKRSSDDRGKSLSQLNGESGFVVKGEYYLGRKEDDSTNLEIAIYGINHAGGFDIDLGVSKIGIEPVINALCEDVPLTRNRIFKFSTSCSHPEFQSKYGPMVYAGPPDIRAVVVDLCLEKLIEADNHLSEFMGWVIANGETIRDAGGFVESALREFIKAKQSGSKIGRVTEQSGARYLKEAQKIFSKLKPPKNNRMDYLIACNHGYDYI